MADLAAAGCRYIQFDEVAIALLCDPAIRSQVEGAGGKPDGLVDLYIDGINHAAAALPSGGRGRRPHVPRQLQGPLSGGGGYESVAEQLFTQAKVNHFLLEYDTPRAGDFKPLRFVPKNKGVVLGLISSGIPDLKSVDALRRRTEEAAKHIDLDRLAIGPQ